MDSMSPKSAELSQLARNQLLVEQSLKNKDISGLRTRRRRSLGIVSRSVRFVFSLIPYFWQSRKKNGRTALMRQNRRRIKT